jgi:hypothetical protein
MAQVKRADVGAEQVVRRRDRADGDEAALRRKDFCRQTTRRGSVSIRPPFCSLKRINRAQSFPLFKRLIFTIFSLSYVSM